MGLFSSVWSEKARIEFSFEEKNCFLKKIKTFCARRFSKKSKALGLEKSSNFLKIFSFRNGLIFFCLVRKSKN